MRVPPTQCRVHKRHGDGIEGAAGQQLEQDHGQQLTGGCRARAEGGGRGGGGITSDDVALPMCCTGALAAASRAAALVWQRLTRLHQGRGGPAKEGDGGAAAQHGGDSVCAVTVGGDMLNQPWARGVGRSHGRCAL